MKKFSFCIGFLLLSFFAIENVKAADIFFDKGKNLFNEKKNKEAKFNFEKDIVFNPKNELSYLYLAKIFKIEEKLDLEKNNLDTVILLNPRNEDAIYELALLSIKESNFEKARELIETLETVCKKLCTSKKELKNKLKNASK